MMLPSMTSSGEVWERFWMCEKILVKKSTKSAVSLL
jgi:hypothetical protein